MEKEGMAKVDFSEAVFLTPAGYNNVRNETKKKEGLKDKIREKIPAGSPVKPQFLDILENAVQEAEPLPSPEASEEVLQNLLDEVHSAGDALKSHLFPEEIKQYKKAVRNFIHYITENGYTMETRTGIPNYLKSGFKGQRGSDAAKARNEFHLIHIVDQKLEQLAAAILAGQASQLELLARIDEITGLLVDLLH
jgi:uncharacterized protein YaaR (DUF327 family)